MIAAYRHPDRVQGRQLMTDLIRLDQQRHPHDTGRDPKTRADPETPHRRRAGLLRPARHIQRPNRSHHQKLENLHAAAARLERGETFDPSPPESGSPSICQVSVKSSVGEEPEDEIHRVRETSAKYGEDLDLEMWLGVRDGIRNYLITAA
jgi:hypothetical protein